MPRTPFRRRWSWPGGRGQHSAIHRSGARGCGRFAFAVPFGPAGACFRACGWPTPSPAQRQEPDLDLDRCYRRLSRQQRAVVTLHYQYGYTIDECATLIGCQPGTARSHLARALASLRKELEHA